MEIALISDTHIPSRATRIPPGFRERIRAADHVIHAGDFDSEGALADQRDLAPALTGVAGNMDPRIGLPAVARVERDGVEFVVTHGTGSTRGYRDRVAATVRKEAEGTAVTVVGVSGHTHEVLDEIVDGVRLLNPGSATGAAPASRTTMMTARVEDGNLDVTVHET
jgi:putative phosphoesterase